MGRLTMTPEGLSSGRDGAASLREAFEECMQTMVEVGGERFQRSAMLAPGLTENAVRAHLDQIGVEPPDELVTYWTLHNGRAERQTAGAPLSVWDPMSIEAAISAWRTRSAYWQGGARTGALDSRANPDWLELSYDRPLVAFTKAAQEGPCPVERIDAEMGHDLGESGPPWRLTSLCVIFDAISEGIREGVIAAAYNVPRVPHDRYEISPDSIEWLRFLQGSNVL